MEADERSQFIAFLVMIVLEIVLIFMLISKIRAERKFAKSRFIMREAMKNGRKSKNQQKYE